MVPPDLPSVETLLSARYRLFSTPTLDYAANISLTGFFLDVGRQMPLSFRLLPGQLSPMTVALVPSSQPGVRTHSKRGR
jgi:hypothetical protein